MVQQVIRTKHVQRVEVGVDGVDVNQLTVVGTECLAEVGVKFELVVTQKAVVRHVVVRTYVGHRAVRRVNLLDVGVGRQTGQRPQPHRAEVEEGVATLLVFKTDLEGVVSNVTRTGRTHTELLVVEDVVAVALRAHVAPQAVGAGRVLAIQQRVAVLHLQQAGVRAWFEHHCVARSKSDGWGVVEQREELRVDRRQLRVVLRSVEGHEGVLPSVVDIATRSFVVAVAVLLEDVKLADVAVAEEVVAVADVLALEVALAVVGHDGVEDVLQSTAASFPFFVHKALRELHVSAPVEARRLVVVLPVHQRTTAVKLVVELHRTGCTKGQLGRFVGGHIELGHQVGGLA